MARPFVSHCSAFYATTAARKNTQSHGLRWKEQLLNSFLVGVVAWASNVKLLHRSNLLRANPIVAAAKCLPCPLCSERPPSLTYFSAHFHQRFLSFANFALIAVVKIEIQRSQCRTGWKKKESHQFEVLLSSQTKKQKAKKFLRIRNALWDANQAKFY